MAVRVEAAMRRIKCMRLNGWGAGCGGWFQVMGTTSLWSTEYATTVTVDYYGNENYDGSDTSNNMYQVKGRSRTVAILSV
jgi:hypothetical protein